MINMDIIRGMKNTVKTKKIISVMADEEDVKVFKQKCADNNLKQSHVFRYLMKEFINAQLNDSQEDLPKAG